MTPHRSWASLVSSPVFRVHRWPRRSPCPPLAVAAFDTDLAVAPESPRSRISPVPPGAGLPAGRAWVPPPAGSPPRPWSPRTGPAFPQRGHPRPSPNLLPIASSVVHGWQDGTALSMVGLCMAWPPVHDPLPRWQLLTAGCVHAAATSRREDPAYTY
jgi:hypothetical protein